ncbi:MAG: hypothetical protein ACI3VB_04670 [Oscillospiraceae bacterium]
MLDASAVGCRSIDAAQSCFNEKQVDSAIQKSGVPREDIFPASKVRKHGRFRLPQVQSSASCTKFVGKTA